MWLYGSNHRMLLQRRKTKDGKKKLADIIRMNDLTRGNGDNKMEQKMARLNTE